MFFTRILSRIRRRRKSTLATSVFDLDFDTPLGIRNRFDPNGDHIPVFENALSSFIEFGPITPDPQGSHGPVPNKGAQMIARHLRGKRGQRLHIAAIIVKNPSTDFESAAHDYEFCFSQLYDYVDMFFINVSEESVPGAKQLQEIDLLTEIVDNLLNLRLYFNDYKAILIQVSPDLPVKDLDEIIHYVRSSGADGIVSENVDQIKYIHKKTDGRLPVVSKVPFYTAEEAVRLLQSGADLIETSHNLAGLTLRAVFLHRFKKALKAAGYKTPVVVTGADGKSAGGGKMVAKADCTSADLTDANGRPAGEGNKEVIENQEDE